MATPVDLEDFGIGFNLSENLIDRADQILAIYAHEAELDWISRIKLPPENAECRNRISACRCLFHA
jgi:FdhD protein